MAGHSKWANIKHTKAKQDKKRSNIFGKLSKNITVAARAGGDPSTNFKLRLAIDKAKQYNMPKDNIERAVKKGTGELEGEQIIEITYEGYGPGGVAFIVEAATDNKNRSAANIRSIFAKHNGSLGATNSVLWMFERKGLIRLAEVQNNDDLTLDLIDLGVEDIADEDDGLTLTMPANVFETVRNYCDEHSLNVEFAETSLIPSNEVEVSDDKDKEKIQLLVDTLLDDEDVVDVSTNASL